VFYVLVEHSAIMSTSGPEFLGIELADVYDCAHPAELDTPTPNPAPTQESRPQPRVAVCKHLPFSRPIKQNNG
jgi:hypothetical protein